MKAIPLKDWPFGLVVFDEASRLRNGGRKGSVTWKAMNAVSRKTTSRILLMSGSPRPGTAHELWGPVALLDRGLRLGQTLADQHVSMVLFSVTWLFAVVCSMLAKLYFSSTRGLVTQAIRDNELRVEYMGGSVANTMAINFSLAAFLGGMGGALAVMALGHIDPNFSYWTTSGEFVFVAILAGSQSVLAVMLSSLVLEMVRSFSSAYFPSTWQLALGLFLLLVIRFLPEGLGSLWTHRKAKP
jgi:branched-chain amino acid transport system permease protein